MAESNTFKIGVDVGGTFTDVTLVGNDGIVSTYKTPSTPSAPAAAVLKGLTEAIRLSGRAPQDCSGFVHGSTIGVNTIIRRDGARVGMLLTRGFEDVLELARCKMPDPFSLFATRPLPLVRRNFVRGVAERVDGKGEIVKPLDRDSLLGSARELLAQGAEVLAVSFLNAYRNPAHEQQACSILRETFPDTPVSASTDVWPQSREYERSTVLAMNSYIAPRVKSYLTDLIGKRERVGLDCPYYMTSSNGGVIPIQHAAERPINTLLSGPSSGVVATLQLMRSAGIQRAISMDIGGTSADLCVLEGDAVPYAWDQEIAGLPIMLPSVDVSSIGAGGGSIAYADNLGLLRVGPQSAGAEPGPVAYGRGGAEPTVTDAYLVSGFIDPENFLGGRVKLHPQRAADALGALGARLGLRSQEVASGILQVATSSIVAEFTRLAAKKGLDVREFVLIPFGGAGATHACLVADELQIGHIAIPYSPGTFCATGAVLSDFRLDYVKNIYCPFDQLSRSEADSWFDEVERQAWQTLSRSSRDILEVRVLRAAGVRYRGQGFEVPVQFERLDDLPELFAEAYGRLYGPRTNDGPLDVISLRATVVGATAKPSPVWPGGELASQASGVRRIQLQDGPIECPVYRRSQMAPGWSGRGPFVVDQPDTTCVVTHGWGADVDSYGTLHLRKGF